MAKKPSATKEPEDTKLVGVRLDQPLQDAIQAWLDDKASNGLDLTLSQAVRYLLWVGIRTEAKLREKTK